MTRKFFAALTLLAVLLTSSLTFAAFEENIEEDADLKAVKKLAVAYPSYYKVAEEEPSISELVQDSYSAGKLVSNFDIISYAEVAAAILRDTGVDLTSLNALEAEKLFIANIGKYADAYVVETVTNGANRPWLFFYVYNAADSKLMYTYSVQSRYINKNAKDYQKAAEDFYKQFAEAADKTLSKEERKKAEEKKRYETGGKKKIKKVTYRTGKSKEDLVKKK